MSSTRHIMMKARTDGSESQQVYSDKFADYDYAWYLMTWLNNHSDGWGYWLEQVDT